MKPWVLHHEPRDRHTPWWTEVLQWLTENVPDKHLIPEDTTLFVAEGYLDTEEFATDAAGDFVVDPDTGDVTRRRLTVRLRTAPPQLPPHVAAREDPPHT